MASGVAGPGARPVARKIAPRSSVTEFDTVSRHSWRQARRLEAGLLAQLATRAVHERLAARRRRPRGSPSCTRRAGSGAARRAGAARRRRRRPRPTAAVGSGRRRRCRGCRPAGRPRRGRPRSTGSRRRRPASAGATGRRPRALGRDRAGGLHPATVAVDRASAPVENRPAVWTIERHRRRVQRHAVRRGTAYRAHSRCATRRWTSRARDGEGTRTRRRRPWPLLFALVLVAAFLLVAYLIASYVVYDTLSRGHRRVPPARTRPTRPSRSRAEGLDAAVDARTRCPPRRTSSSTRATRRSRPRAPRLVDPGPDAGRTGGHPRPRREELPPRRERPDARGHAPRARVRRAADRPCATTATRTTRTCGSRAGPRSTSTCSGRGTGSSRRACPRTEIGILGMSFGAATTVIAGGEEPRRPGGLGGLVVRRHGPGDPRLPRPRGLPDVPRARRPCSWRGSSRATT